TALARRRRRPERQLPERRRRRSLEHRDVSEPDHLPGSRHLRRQADALRPRDRRTADQQKGEEREESAGVTDDARARRGGGAAAAPSAAPARACSFGGTPQLRVARGARTREPPRCPRPASPPLVYGRTPS